MLDADGFIGELYQTIMEEITLILQKPLQKSRNGQNTSLLVCETIKALILKCDKDNIRKENYLPVSLMNIDPKFLNN